MIKTFLLFLASCCLWYSAASSWQAHQPSQHATIDSLALPNHDHHHDHHHAHGHEHRHHTHHGKGFDCGFDALQEQLFQRYPERRRHSVEAEERWQMGVEAAWKFNATGGVHTLPVVVHVVHQNGPANLSDATVQTAIQRLNEAFANVGYYNPNTGVDTEIQFCLASRDTSGNATTGITRTLSALTTMNQNTQDLALKNLVRWNPNDYINIWVVNEIVGGTAGYAYFPSSHGQAEDGIVIEASTLDAGPAEAAVLVHEMGHYFGLYHTFEGGCTNADCTADGDRVCDTPPDQTTARPPCNTVVNSCTSDEDDPSTNNPFRALALGGLGDQPDQKENYLDYSNLGCYNQFSQGQADRMQFFLHGDRQSLLRARGCQPACPNPLQVRLTTSGVTTTVGTPLTFSDSSLNNSTSQWLVNGTLVSSNRLYNHTFTAVGVYWVRLIVGNGNPFCEETDSIQVTVFCAPPCGEICDNGLDDDGNGLIDCFDTACDCAPCTNKQSNQWYFGRNGTLNFNTTPPSTAGTSRINTGEASTARCDENGNLLFYTDGITVWDRTHTVMQNGTGILGHESLAQIALVPRPDHPNIFYLFIPNMQTRNSGLTYSTIDMLQNNNLGAVTQKNIYLTNQPTTEHITAIRHCNQRDYWVIVKEFQSNRYKIFEVTSAGINPVPLVQNIGQPHLNIGGPVDTMIYSNTIGTMRASVQGDQIALTHRINSGFELFDFDNSTGVLSNPRYWENSFWDTPYGVEFSPNGKILYGSMAGRNELYQFDITLPTSAAILSSTYMLSFFSRGADLQLASNGRIYIGRSGQTTISYIAFPNVLGAGATYILGGLNLPGSARNVTTLGNYNKADLFPSVDIRLQSPAAICNLTNPRLERFELGDLGCGIDSVVWRHSGPNTIQSSSDSLLLLNVAVPGSDTVWVTVTTVCSTQTEQAVLNTSVAPVLDLGPDTSICQNGILVLNPGPNYAACEWQDGSRDATFTASESGWYWASCTTYCGDTLRDSVYLTIATTPSISYPDTTINWGEVATFSPLGGTGYQHQWSPSAGLSCTTCPMPLFSPDSTTVYYHTYTNAAGCVGLDTLVVTITYDCVPLARLDSVQGVCLGGNNGALHISGYQGIAPYAYQWSTGDTTPSLTGLAAGDYSVTVTDSVNCFAIDTFTVPVLPNPSVVVDTVALPICGQRNGVLVAQSSGANGPYTYRWSTNVTTDTLPNLGSGRYTVVATSADGCTGSAFAALLDQPSDSLQLATIVADTCGQGEGQIFLQPMTQDPPYTYTWSNGGTGLSQINLAAGTYTITASSANGCTTVQRAIIPQLGPPSLTAYLNAPGNSTATLTVNQSFQVVATPDWRTNGSTYEWLTTTLLLDSTAVPATTGTATDTGQYLLQVVLTDTYGCTASDTLWLYVNAGFQGLPNSFTPNGDGMNDVFRPLGLPREAVETFRIFNRWGAVIFDQGEGPIGWNGVAKGVEQPTGVYLYVLRYQLAGHPVVELRGGVTLLR